MGKMVWEMYPFAVLQNKKYLKINIKVQNLGWIRWFMLNDRSCQLSKKTPDGYFQKKNSLNATLVADKAQEEHSTP